MSDEDGETGTAPERDPDVVRYEREVALRAERIRQLADELRATKRELGRVERREARIRTRLEATRAELASLRRRRVVRIALRVAAIAQAGRRGVRRLRKRVATRMPWGRPAHRHRRQPRVTASDERRLRAQLDAHLEPSAATGPLVSIIIVNRDGLAHLRRLLPALDRLAYRPFEVIVVDNASTDGSVEFVTRLAASFPVQVIRNSANRSFSDANNQGAERASGEYLLLLNNDTEPAGPHVLGHLVANLEDPTVAAVGSRLIYPLREGGRRAHADLALQHRGIRFVTADGNPLARNVGAGEDPLGAAASTAREVVAASAACLLVRRSSYQTVGGFTAGFDYGSEDVDLALKLTAAGYRIRYEPQATFWHHESATQHREDGPERTERQRRNRALLADRWGPRLFRETFLDRLSGGGTWADGPLHVAIALTREDPSAGFGDWHTGHELGDALAALGWRVSYIERFEDRWYEPDPSVDVVVALLDSLDIRRLPDGVVTVAWVRNWTERWIEQPWFDEFDVVLASSDASKQLIDARSSHVAEVFPIATNPDRFRLSSDQSPPEVDVVFAGNRWGQPREAEIVLTHLALAGRRVRVHGSGWEDAALGGLAAGPLAYDDVPRAYANAAIVLDDAASPTKPYGSVNSRVFDALAAGRLVVTDNTIGAAELFDGLLPAADTPTEVAALVESWLDDPDARATRVAQLRQVVLDHHTYAARAERLRAILHAWAMKVRVDIAISTPRWEVAELWGDYHFGRALQRALVRRGHAARLRLSGSWGEPAAARADAAIQVVGLSNAPRRPGQVTATWVISHPERVRDEMLEAVDIVFVASDQFAAHLAARTRTRVVPLHQATDPERFAPTPGGPRHELLFVANSRGVRRRIVDELTPTDRDLAVYGSAWTPELLAPEYLRGTHVPNRALAGHYSAADIVLNDHWGEMAEHGFMSNRLYDASAAGAFVISDAVAGIDAEFDGGVVTFRSGDELRRLVDRYLADPAARSEHADRARRAVLERHTFAHRAAAIDKELQPLLGQPIQVRLGLPPAAGAAVPA